MWWSTVDNEGWRKLSNGHNTWPRWNGWVTWWCTRYFHGNIFGRRTLLKNNAEKDTMQSFSMTTAISFQGHWWLINRAAEFLQNRRRSGAEAVEIKKNAILQGWLRILIAIWFYKCWKIYWRKYTRSLQVKWRNKAMISLQSCGQ